MRKFLDQLFGRGKQRQNAARRRNLLAGVEMMEARRVLDASPWCNVPMPADVNNDGVISSLDAQAVGTTISNNGGSTVSVVQGTSPSNGGFPDATNDWLVNQSDVDFVTNAIAQASGSGSSSAGGTASGGGSGTATSTGSGNFTIGDASVTEGGDLKFTVTFHGTATGPAVTIKTMNYGAAGYSAGPAGGYAGDGTGGGMLDYDAKTETMIFTGVDGETHDFVVHTHNDTVTEWTEFMTARITAVSSMNGANLTIGTPRDGKGIIEDNDTAVVTTTAPAGINMEGNNPAAPAWVAVPVWFTGSIEMPGLTIGYSTADGTAHAGSDFVGVNGTYTLPWGVQTGFFVNVVFVSDTTVEKTSETFNVVLGAVGGGGGNGSSSGVSIGNPSTSTITITDEDTAFITIAWKGATTVTEGTDLVGTVTFIGTSDVGGGTVDISTSGITAFADDGTGGDYDIPDPTHLHVDSTNAASWAKDFTIHTKNDSTVEAATETFNVSLANLVLDDPSVAPRITISITPSMNTLTGTINDNDSSVLSINSVSTWEEDFWGWGVTQTFTLSLSNPVDIPITVTVTPGLGGSSPAGFAFGADLTAAASYTVTFAPGVQTMTVSTTTVPDMTSEGGGIGGIETYLMTITAWGFTGAPGSRAVTLGNWVGQGTITSNDP